MFWTAQALLSRLLTQERTESGKRNNQKSDPGRGISRGRRTYSYFPRPSSRPNIYGVSSTVPSRTRNSVKITREDGTTATISAYSLPADLRVAIFLRDGTKCRYCGHRGPVNHFEIDHIVPRSKGGTDEKSNLVVACWICNHYKGQQVWEPGVKPWNRPDFDSKRWSTMRRRLKKRKASRQSQSSQRPRRMKATKWHNPDSIF